MGLIRRLFAPGSVQQRSQPLAFYDWASWFAFNGHQYPFGLQQTAPGQKQELPDGSFAGMVAGVYKTNGVVFACMLARMLLFSEARFQFRRLRSGRPGELFGTAALDMLDSPWEGGTTGDLLTRAIQDADLAGNFYAVRRPDGIKRLRPDWVTIVLGTNDPDADAWDVDADVLGYVYQPGGPASGRPQDVFLAGEVAHFAPIPDPAARYRGMSWLGPVLSDIVADGAATAHKLKFFENGATPNAVVTMDASVTRENFERYVQAFRDGHDGLANAYKTLFLGGGADIKVIGTDLRQLEFKQTQGAGETRIAAAAGVPPVIVGLSEGLQAATYSNYGQARRRFADGTMRPLWRNIAGSLARITDVPAASELWYDDRDIPFLQEDVRDAAEVQQMHASSIQTLINAGYEPDAIIDAVVAGDLARLRGKHTGLTSVQLQPPQDGSEPASNGRPPALIEQE